MGDCDERKLKETAAAICATLQGRPLPDRVTMRDEDCPTIYCNALCTQRQTQSHSDPASVLARVTARAAGSLWVGVNSTEPVRTWRSVAHAFPAWQLPCLSLRST